jgi:hypothetical protein
LGAVIFAEIAQISFRVDEVGSLCPQADCGFHAGSPLLRVVPDEVPHGPGFELCERKIQDGETWDGETRDGNNRDGKARHGNNRERKIFLALAIREHRGNVQAGLSHAEYNTSEPV